MRGLFPFVDAKDRLVKPDPLLDASPEAVRPDRRRLLTGAAWVAAATALPVAAGAPSAPPQSAPLADVGGRLALVAGGAGGIGLGMARAFVAAGMRVVITSAQDEALANAMNFFRDTPRTHIMPMRLDMNDREAWPRLAEDVEKHHGPVNLLCINASVAPATGLVRAAYRDWDQALSQNLGSVFAGVHTYLPRMLAQEEPAHLLATSSMSGLLPVGNNGLYNMCKASVIGLMESLRTELDGEDIGVSVFCPGLVHTNLPPGDAARPRPPGMDPLEAGQQALRGVRSNDLFILPHAEFREGLQERFDAILAAAAEGEAPPASRIAAEQTMLHNPMYAPDPDRRRGPRR
ncbi:MAG: alpha-dehydrogenase [Pseudomonadota bacterium]|jgi:NAD(P)-dependent dehydrogenase (short-subunit alcohol dehydrogenase family)